MQAQKPAKRPSISAWGKLARRLALLISLLMLTGLAGCQSGQENPEHGTSERSERGASPDSSELAPEPAADVDPDAGNGEAYTGRDIEGKEKQRQPADIAGGSAGNADASSGDDKTGDPHQ